MRLTDFVFGAAVAGLAALVLLASSEDAFLPSAAAAIACLVIAAGASWIVRWHDEALAGRRSGRASRFARRLHDQSLGGLPWPVRALISLFWWAVGTGITLRVADWLVLSTDAARAIFYVLLGAGTVVILVGEFANRHEGAQGSGRPSQSS